MTSLLKSIRSITNLFQLAPTLPQDRDTRYLSQATDLYDLERRMRELDAGRSSYKLLSDYDRYMH